MAAKKELFVHVAVVSWILVGCDGGPPALEAEVTPESGAAKAEVRGREVGTLQLKTTFRSLTDRYEFKRITRSGDEFIQAIRSTWIKEDLTGTGRLEDWSTDPTDEVEKNDERVPGKNDEPGYSKVYLKKHGSRGRVGLRPTRG